MSSRYKDILDNIEWSFSTLNQYCTCPYSMYLKKIEGIRGDDNAYAEIGSYGHDLNERIFKGEISVQEALEECIDEFEDHIFYYISESSKEKKYQELCDYLAEFNDEFRDDYDVLGVEVEFHWKIGKYKCIGFADLILKRKSDGAVFLVDHKSAPHFLKKDGTPLKNQEENLNTYKKQMYMYADAMKKKLGFYPDYIVWNHFLDKSNATVIPFLKEELDEALNWFKETVSKIYKDKEFEAIDSYMMCGQLCNYRYGLCDYKEMRREEREE